MRFRERSGALADVHGGTWASTTDGALAEVTAPRSERDTHTLRPRESTQPPPIRPPEISSFASSYGLRGETTYRFRIHCIRPPC